MRGTGRWWRDPGQVLVPLEDEEEENEELYVTLDDEENEEQEEVLFPRLASRARPPCTQSQMGPFFRINSR